MGFSERMERIPQSKFPKRLKRLRPDKPAKVERPEAVRIGEGLLGCRWEMGGRGPDRFDCFGLALWCLRESYGAIFAEFDDEKPQDKYMRFSSWFHEVKQAEPGDLLYFDWEPRPHLVWVESDRTTLETTKDLGVMRVPLSKQLLKGPKIYRYNGRQ